MFMSYLIKRQLQTIAWTHMHTNRHYVDLKLQHNNIKSIDDRRQHNLQMIAWQQLHHHCISIKICVLKYMPSNFLWGVLQPLINMSLPDKCLSIDSHAMGVDTSHDESIAIRVQSSYTKPRGEKFISSSSSFQTNLSRNITCIGDFCQK